MEQRFAAYWWLCDQGKTGVSEEIQALTAFPCSHVINSERKENLGVGMSNNLDI